MHPANLRKWNYQEETSVDDGMFSLPNLPPEFGPTNNDKSKTTTDLAGGSTK